MLPLLRIEGLSVDFMSAGVLSPGLKQVDLTVNKGEIVSLVGESGSGKSVTSLSILQLLPSPPAIYQSGRILFSENGIDAVDLLKADSKTMQSIRGQKIAMIFQEPMTSLNPVISCGKQVAEAILAHKDISHAAAKKQTLQWFHRVKLPDPEGIYDRYPHQLSGGQKQRVMIAMAMCCSPSLLICDEPTTALDVTVQKSILHLIRELQQESGMGVIFITHDLGVVAEIADRTIVMYKGEILEQGSVKQIFNNPSHPYTKGLLACRPLNHPKGKRLPVVADFWNQGQEKIHPAAIVGQSASTLENKAIVSNEVLLDVENLTVSFPARKNIFGKPLSYTRAVDDVSFSIYEGETLGLVGESGCGKTTLGRSLLRLIEPTSGRIMYKDMDLASKTGKELRALRKDLQLIFQDPYSSLNPRITIGSAIAEPMKVHHIADNSGKRKDRVVELLENVGLQSSHYERYPHEFSGGQRQRIVIARALALNPSFIVCDESVSALDVSVQAQVLNLLNDLKKKFGFTVVFISHDLSVVHYISDRILVMNKGRIEESGPADEIYFHPRSAYTQKLISSIPAVVPS